MKKIRSVDEQHLDALIEKEMEQVYGGSSPKDRDISFKIGPGQISPGIGVSVVF